MKKYLSFFRLRFLMGLQYRAAAAAGVLTQFAWGFMEIMMYRAFYHADAAAFPMSFEATASYIWLQQAFLAVFAAWMLESEIFDAIKNGGLAYELCRPIRIYNMWFARSAANRLSRAALRCMPILLAAAFVPRPYGLSLPASPMHFFLFLITLCTGLAVTVSFSMLIYMLTFFTISPQGVQILFTSCVEFLAGAIVPIPFFPGEDREDLGASALRVHAECSPADLQREHEPGGDGAGGGAADRVAGRNYGSWKMAVLDGGPAAGDRTGRVMG